MHKIKTPSLKVAHIPESNHMDDKALDEVMGEFKKKVDAMDACGYDCSECIDSINKFIPKACRSYALKVVEEIINMQKEICGSVELNNGIIKLDDAMTVLDRLTDKGPK